MPVDKEYVSHVMDMLAPIGGVHSRAMFGGYGIFHDGDMFALISSASRLYFKVDDTNRKRFEEAGSEQFQGMPYFELPVDVLETPDELREWAIASITVGHATAKRRRN